MQQETPIAGLAWRHGSRQGAVHSVDRIVFTVPNLDQAEEFYRAFGLRCVRGNGDWLDVGTFDSSHIWMTVFAGSVKQLQYITFGVFEADIAPLHQRLLATDAQNASAHPLAHQLGEDAGTWLEAPDGLAVRVAITPKRSPDQKSVPTRFAAVQPGCGAAPKRSGAGVVKPRYLSHVLLFTPDVSRALGFYVGTLGLRISDRSGDDIAFLHGAHGSDHHLVAFARSTGPGLHHTSWDVGSIHEVGLGAQQMRDRGYLQGWGLGRHVLGSNYFHYVRDPWGSYAEYSCDMDFVPKDMDWPAVDHVSDDAFYIWGPSPPDDFTENFELCGRR